jgi:hypothetical protein
MKTRVVTRAFYEDAYLDFFITYYISIGFDEIYILKADTDPEYKMQPYVLPSWLSEEDKLKIIVISVKNTGNMILREHYDKIKDESVDWVLNIDCDEFLFLDWEKYSNGINQYLEQYLQKLEDTNIVNDKNKVQQLKYRWICINKMDINWDKHYNTFLGYIHDNDLHAYNYIKSFGATKYMIDQKDARSEKDIVNCHFFYNRNDNKYIDSESYWVLDNEIIKKNESNPRHLRKDGTACLWGFILHINSRTLSNVVTKCLVTELRKNKKINDMQAFTNFINDIHKQDLSNDNILQNIKIQFYKFLNHKGIFPRNIKVYHNARQEYYNIEKIKYTVINKIIDTKVSNKYDILNIPFCNIELEYNILKQLCKDNNINYNNLVKIMKMF